MRIHITIKQQHYYWNDPLLSLKSNLSMAGLAVVKGLQIFIEWFLKPIYVLVNSHYNKTFLFHNHAWEEHVNCHAFFYLGGCEVMPGSPLYWWGVGITSLAPGRFEWMFRKVILKANFTSWWLMYFLWNHHLMNVTQPYLWSVNIGSGNGLVPSGNKPLPEPMLTQIFVAKWCH